MSEKRTFGIQFEEKIVDSTTVLAVSGNIDTDNYQEFESQVSSLLDGGARTLILDLERAPLINSMGVGVIVRAYRQLKDLEGGLVLLSPSPGIRQVLTTLMLEKKLSITTSLEDALRILGPLGGLPD